MTDSSKSTKTRATKTKCSLCDRVYRSTEAVHNNQYHNSSLSSFSCRPDIGGILFTRDESHCLTCFCGVRHESNSEFKASICAYLLYGLLIRLAETCRYMQRAKSPAATCGRALYLHMRCWISLESRCHGTHVDDISPSIYLYPFQAHILECIHAKIESVSPRPTKAASPKSFNPPAGSSSIIPPFSIAYTPSNQPSADTARPFAVIEGPNLAPGMTSEDILSGDFVNSPDKHSIQEHDGHLLSKYCLLIDTCLASFVCLSCRKAISFQTVEEHVRGHARELRIPDDLLVSIDNAYHLSKGRTHPSKPVAARFPLSINPRPLHFCDHCNRGYDNTLSLSAHQKVCDKSISNGKASHLGFAQSSGSRMWFEVTVDRLEPKSPLPSLVDIFVAAIPPPIDYRQAKIGTLDDTASLSHFLHREGWHEHVKPFTPAELATVHQIHDRKDTVGCSFRDLAKKYIAGIQSSIDSHTGFGLMRNLGNLFGTGEASNHKFRRISPGCIDGYSLVLHQLVYSCYRYYVSKEWATKYEYPILDDSQLAPLHALAKEIKAPTPRPALLKTHFCDFVFKLLLHSRDQYDTSRDINRFFTPSICFLVIRSVTKDGGLNKASVITKDIAALTYCTRTSVLYEIERLKGQGVSEFE